MDYEVTLNNGREIQKIILEGTNFNADEFTKTLNDHTVSFVNLAGAIERKSNIESMRPIEAPSPKNETQSND